MQTFVETDLHVIEITVGLLTVAIQLAKAKLHISLLINTNS